MSIDRRLRDADPAAARVFDANSPQAQAMLTAILDTHRDSKAAERAVGPRRRSRPQRLVLAGALAVLASATAALAPALHDGGPVGTTTAAYAVSVQADGSVHVTVEWDQLLDPAGLAAALRKAGVPTVVRSAGRTTRLGYEHCGTRTEQDQADAAMTATPSSKLIVLRPNLFPAHSTMVIASSYLSQAHVVSMYLTHTDTPWCAISWIAGVLSARPATTPVGRPSH